MALRPKFGGLQLVLKGETRHTLELYLDYVCPFSAKLFNTFHKLVQPIIATKHSARLQVIFRPQIQPWHPSSTLTHEAAVAILRIAPEKFWEFSDALFKEQKSFFDENVVNETRNQTYARLAKLASSIGVDEKEVYSLLEISDKPGSSNAGNEITNDIKLITRANRVVGNHVTPTVFFDGIEERSIGSSFTATQWEDWLEKNVI